MFFFKKKPTKGPFLTEVLDRPTHHHYAFFGNDPVAAETLRMLWAAGYSAIPVITNPPAPKGRGMQPAFTPVAQVAFDHHSDHVLMPAVLDHQALINIQSYSPEYGICVAYGKILPQEFINAFPKGILNIHYSLLPKYRGAAPVEAALRNNDAVTGVTIQKMVRELDAGDIVAQKEVEILPNETALELRARLVTLGAELLIEILPDFIAGKITPTPQDHRKATHVGKLTKEDGLLDLSADPLLNWSKYRAYAEWPGTYFFTERNDRRIRVKITSAAYEDGAFKILRVIPEGKKEMDYGVFTRSNAN